MAVLSTLAYLSAKYVPTCCVMYSVVVPALMNLSTVEVRMPIGCLPLRVASRNTVVVAWPPEAVSISVNV